MVQVALAANKPMRMQLFLNYELKAIRSLQAQPVRGIRIMVGPAKTVIQQMLRVRKLLLIQV